MFAFLGERRTLADTRRGSDDGIVHNSMEPDPAVCKVSDTPSDRPSKSPLPADQVYDQRDEQDRPDDSKAPACSPSGVSVISPASPEQEHQKND
jgi:hypothetical protein